MHDEIMWIEEDIVLTETPESWWQVVTPGMRLLYVGTNRVVEVVSIEPEARKLTIRRAA